MERAAVDILLSRLAETRRFIQVVAGPRQVGKTTVVRQALARRSLAGVVHGAGDHAPVSLFALTRLGLSGRIVRLLPAFAAKVKQLHCLPDPIEPLFNRHRKEWTFEVAVKVRMDDGSVGKGKRGQSDQINIPSENVAPPRTNRHFLPEMRIRSL